jgi:hypothetical protein
MPRVCAVIIMSATAVLAGCGASAPPPVEAGGAGPTVRLVIDLPAGAVSGDEDLAMLARIEGRLSQRGIGVRLGTMARDRAMEASFRVNDAGRARRAMDVVMAAEAPTRGYRVEVSPTTSAAP